MAFSTRHERCFEATLSGLSAYARCRASPPGDHAWRIFLHLALTVWMAIQSQGFFPSQDTGVISGISEACKPCRATDDAPATGARGVIPSRPDVAAMGSQTGSTDSPNPPNVAGYHCAQAARRAHCHSRQIIDRLRPQLAKVQGANVFLQPTQDINVGARIGRGSSSIT